MSGTDTGAEAPPPPSLAWRTMKNSAWGIASFAWPLLIALFTTPFIVHRLGGDLYGVLTIVGITLGFFGVLDLGIGGAATRQIAAYVAKEDPDNVNRVVSTVLAFYLAVGAVTGIAILLLSNTFVTTLLDIPAALQHTALLAFYISAPSFLVTLLSGAFGSIPPALQRYDISTKMNIAFSIVSTAITIGLLWTGHGLISLVVAGLAFTIASIPISYAVAKRLIPTLAIRPHWDGVMFRELFSFGGYFLVSTIGVMVLYQMDKILVGRYIGIAAVTLYVVPGGIAQKIQGVTAAATGVVFPMSAALFETGRREKLVTLYLQGTRLVYILITAMAVPLAVFADKFLLYWMGPEIAAGSSVAMVILVGTYYMLSFTAIPWQIANGSGRAKINALFTLAIAAADIALFFVLVRPFGLPGAAAAYLISAFVGAPVLVSVIERRVLGLSGFEFLKVYWRIGLVGVAQAGVSLLMRPLCGRLLTTVAAMAVSAAVFVLIHWLLGFVQESDKRLLAALVQRFRIERPAA